METPTPGFGEVDDFFGFSNVDSMRDRIVPISSDNGDNKQRILVSNATTSGTRQSGAGKYSAGVDAVSGVWRNPTVTYAVIADVTFVATLGKAWAGSGSSRSGYMLTAVEVVTAIGQFPTITCSAVANEGADAINTFGVSIEIVARSKAQALLGAVTGGGKLQSCVLRAECEPVVLAEDMMPCASDVVHGKMTVEADTLNIAGEGKPSAAGGFTEIGEPCRKGDTSYTAFHIVAEKEMT